MPPMRPPVLLHICCAPDATAAAERLAPAYEVLGYFHGPNIHPREEYLLRLDNARRVAETLGFRLLPASYAPEAWDEAVRGLEQEPEGGRRCEACFRHNLTATAAKAKELGVPSFTTTLTISPHKDAAKVFAAGRAAGREHGVEFLELDFKKKDGFRRSLEISKALGLYRQRTCGCRYSARPGTGPRGPSAEWTGASGNAGHPAGRERHDV
jgi:predicted adenine nucleotide alpha hydrolase (AANH) superfamily ATPase